MEGEPDKFHMPESADLRYNWVCVRLDAIVRVEMHKLVTEAWRMTAPTCRPAAPGFITMIIYFFFALRVPEDTRSGRSAAAPPAYS